MILKRGERSLVYWPARRSAIVIAVLAADLLGFMFVLPAGVVMLAGLMLVINVIAAWLVADRYCRIYVDDGSLVVHGVLFWKARVRIPLVMHLWTSMLAITSRS